MRTDVTGEQIELRHGPYLAVVTEVGAALRCLTWNDRDLILRWGDDEVMPLYRGAVLAPWPNVVLGGRYSFDGEEHVLDVSARTGGQALHGFGQWEGWRITARAVDAVELLHALWPRPGYPFRVDLQVSYRLTSNGLHWRLDAVNVGTRRAPYGCAVHPYLVAPSGTMRDWRLQLDAAAVCRSDLPGWPVQQVDGMEGDFRSGRLLGDVVLDHAYTDVAWRSDSTASATVVDAAGNGARMTWGRTCPWVQVYTCDWPTADQHRRGLAVEPMTCPPDAFNRGTDVVVLSPGARHTAWWQLDAVRADVAGGAA